MCISEIDGTTFWTMITALATIAAVFVAYVQLSKISSSNSINILIHLEDEWNDKMRNKRRIFAEKLPNKIETIDDVVEKYGDVIENILDYFEKVAMLSNNNEFNLAYVYELYSYYMQSYWEIICEYGYIDKVRVKYDDTSLYNQYETFYNKLMSNKKYKLEKYTKEDLKKFKEDEKQIDH